MDNAMTKVFGRWLSVSGLVVGGYEGDASIPGGTRRVLEIEEFVVEDEDGNDVTDELSKFERTECEDALIYAALHE
jgi:hypothetical protein